MKAVGIVAEYDPFHNGHYYHLAKSKALTGADVVVCVLSGDFVQRGTPSFYDKYARTRMALDGGADIVLMLPFAFSCQTAEIFAFGAVRLLHNIGCSALSFGAECDDMALLHQAAQVLCRQDHAFSASIKSHLASGRSFAKSRQLALAEHSEAAAALLNGSNNILAIEYIKQILLHQYPITPYVVKRTDVSHDEAAIENNYSSASHIRHLIQQKSPVAAACVPNFVASQLTTLNYNTLENYTNILYQNLLIHTPQSLCTFPDISLDLANKMKKNLDFFPDITTYIDIVSDKHHTKSRIRRSLCHILVNYQYPHLTLYNNAPSYLRLLGFSEKGKNYLNIRGKTDHVLSNIKDAYQKIEASEKFFLDFDLLASNVYQLGIGGQKGIDYKIPPIYLQ